MRGMRPATRRTGPGPRLGRHALRLKRFGRAALVAVPALAAVAGGTWLWRAGIVERAADGARLAVEDASGHAGMRLANVYLDGRVNAAREDILAALDVRRGMPLFAFDPFEAKTRLEALPWVREASVERATPDTIRVQIVEREPFALWQHERRLAVVDRDGVVLSDRDLDRFSNLLLLVGAEAPRHAAGLLEIVAAEPALAERVTAAIWVGDRRWNVRIGEAIEVKLPEDGAAAAWSRLADLDREHAVLQRGVTAIDLRLPDRLLITLANDAMRRPQPVKRQTKDHET